MVKAAFITGVTGQDGSYLSEYLLSLGYKVFGLIRRHSESDNHVSRIDHLKDRIQLLYGDVIDYPSVAEAIRASKPDEIYHLAAQSHVGISFDCPQSTLETNSLGTFNVLEAARRGAPEAHIYHASTSEIFGNCVNPDGLQSLRTPMIPLSPYGISKLSAHHLVNNYRESYGLFALNGVCFNHESPRRGAKFITSKVIRGAIDIKNGVTSKLELGNLDVYRDWGHAKDYVKGMNLALNHDMALDWVFATGETRSVRDLCEIAFSHFGLNYKDHVVQNEKFMRPGEVYRLCGDSRITEKCLGWKREYDFKKLIHEMIETFEQRSSRFGEIRLAPSRENSKPDSESDNLGDQPKSYSRPESLKTSNT